MKRLTVVCATAIALALPLAAYAQHDHGMHHGAMQMAKTEEKDQIFVAYEHARQALLNESISDLKAAAHHIGIVAVDAGQTRIAEQAAGLERATGIKSARTAFAALSDEVIKYRGSRCCGAKPVVVYCSMEKKSWLQPAGEIGNPYLEASMRKCGEVKEQ